MCIYIYIYIYGVTVDYSGPEVTAQHVSTAQNQLHCDTPNIIGLFDEYVIQ